MDQHLRVAEQIKRLVSQSANAAEVDVVGVDTQGQGRREYLVVAQFSSLSLVVFFGPS